MKIHNEEKKSSISSNSTNNRKIRTQRTMYTTETPKEKNSETKSDARNKNTKDTSTQPTTHSLCLARLLSLSASLRSLRQSLLHSLPPSQTSRTCWQLILDLPALLTSVCEGWHAPSLFLFLLPPTTSTVTLIIATADLILHTLEGERERGG